jgi:gluconate kinase
MPAALLDSQFETLQEPTPDERPIIVDVGDKPEEIAADIVSQLTERYSAPDIDFTKPVCARSR